jgi:hypothetical protein
MAVEFWRTSGKTAGTQVKTAVGRLDATGGETTMSADSVPDEVRVYNTGKSNGDSIAFTYSGGTVTFTSYTAVAGDVIMAIAGDVFLFEGLYTVGNSSTEADRTIEDDFFVFVSGTNEENCTITLEDLVAAEGNQTGWFYLSKTDAGDGTGDYTGQTAGADLLIGDITDGSNQQVWAKIIVPEATAKQNARDVILKFQSLSSATN